MTMRKDLKQHSHIFSNFCTTSQHVGPNLNKMREKNCDFKKERHCEGDGWLRKLMQILKIHTHSHIFAKSIIVTQP